MAATFRTALNREEFRTDVLATSKEIIPNNPLVYLHVCHLLAVTGQLPVNDLKSSGLNEAIAKKGFFLIQCDQMVCVPLLLIINIIIFIYIHLFLIKISNN